MFYIYVYFVSGKMHSMHQELANIPKTTLPSPSYPALYRQGATYAWRPTFEYL